MCIFYLVFTYKLINTFYYYNICRRFFYGKRSDESDNSVTRVYRDKNFREPSPPKNEELTAVYNKNERCYKR